MRKWAETLIILIRRRTIEMINGIVIVLKKSYNMKKEDVLQIYSYRVRTSFELHSMLQNIHLKK